MSVVLTFPNVPPQLRSCEGSVADNGDGSCTAVVRMLPGGGTQTGLEVGTDVAIILDASFSMFAGFYRNARVVGFVEAVVDFLKDYDNDGVDVYLHSLKAPEFRHLGAITSADDLMGTIGGLMEPGSAMKEMGTRTICNTAIRDAAHRLFEEKGSRSVFIEIITDGNFDDKEELEATIVELGMRYNSAEHPHRFRVHFSGVGAGGAQGVAFLEYLDEQLASKYPGYIDCVDYDAAATIEANVSNMVRNLQRVVSFNVSNAVATVTGVDGSEATHVRIGDAGEWSEGNVLSLESMPVVLDIHAAFATGPQPFDILLQYVDAATGNFHECTLRAVC